MSTTTPKKKPAPAPAPTGRPDTLRGALAHLTWRARQSHWTPTLTLAATAPLLIPTIEAAATRTITLNAAPTLPLLAIPLTLAAVPKLRARARQDARTTRETQALRTDLDQWLATDGHKIAWKNRATQRLLTGQKQHTPRIARYELHNNGSITAIIESQGATQKTWAAHAEAIARATGYPKPRITIHAGHAHLTFHPAQDAKTEPAIGPWEATIPDTLPDLTALPVARTIHGETATMRLLYSHLLLVGATGSGKGSVLWSIFRCLAPGIDDGTVELWGIDPKGGMEFGAGEDMFARLVGDEDDPDTAIVNLLVEFYGKMRARSRAMKAAKTRKFIPKPGDPYYVLAIDEYLQLAMTITDPKKRDTANKMLIRVLSQGRACGFTVVAACQLAQKTALREIRDLFPLRISLRATDADMVDMTLGDGARKRGARADQIPEGDEYAGIGYMNLADRTPILVRFPKSTDEFVAAMAQAHPAPGVGHLADEPQPTPAVRSDTTPTTRPITKRDKVLALLDAGWTNPQKIAAEAGCTDRFVRQLATEHRTGTTAGRGGPHRVEATSTLSRAEQDCPSLPGPSCALTGPELPAGTPAPAPERSSGADPSTRQQIHPATDTTQPMTGDVPDPLRAAP